MAKQRFLSNMSHELRTPLQSIIGYSEKINQQLHPQKKDMEAIAKSSTHLMQIVNEVLDYNRIVSGKFTFVNQPFKVSDIIDEVITAMRPQAENKNIALKTDYDHSLLSFVNGDSFRLKQVLYNLLGNAIKFTSEGEVLLSVKARAASNALHYFFNVIDTGIGLSPQDTVRIFNEFEQANDQYTGTGLGLPISRELIERQGGKISVSSKLGKGSKFSFDLNYEVVAEPITNDKPALTTNGLDKSGKIWLVDDDAFILDLCSGIFARHNIAHRCFISPNELLNTAWDEDVKYILMDIRMPEMNGGDLCRLLRKKIPGHVKIFALTAQAMAEEHLLVLQQGFDSLLMKPFREFDLIQFIKSDGHYGIGNEDKPGFNISAIEKMTLGDTEETGKILTRFAADSLKDIKVLRKGLKKYNIEAVSLVAHRIAGRTAQIGAKVLAGNFRVAEMELNRDKKLTITQINHFLTLINQLHKLIATAREYQNNAPVL
jgi:CheY-like chemotaxis protein